MENKNYGSYEVAKSEITMCRDKSGSINLVELEEALTSFGYTLSRDVMQLLLRRFDRTNSHAVKFDDFIQCCLVLHVSIFNNLCIMVGIKINTMKTTFLFKFSFLQAFHWQFFHVYVSLLLDGLIEIKIKIESRFHCIDIYDDDCISFALCSGNDRYIPSGGYGSGRSYSNHIRTFSRPTTQLEPS